MITFASSKYCSACQAETTAGPCRHAGGEAVMVTIRDIAEMGFCMQPGPSLGEMELRNIVRDIEDANASPSPEPSNRHEKRRQAALDRRRRA